MSRIDFHIHILPEMDDGSASERQSYRMLRIAEKNKIQRFVATPHFYPNGLAPTEFAQQSVEALKRLEGYYLQRKIGPLPEIRLGAEVLLGYDTPKLEDLRKVAIEDTDYILIEMPYDDWSEWVYEAIEGIRVRHGLIPIIAHIERYVPMQKDIKSIYRLLSMEGILGQINVTSLLDRKSRGICYKLITHYMVHILGTDAHCGRHLVEIDKAYRLLEKRFGKKEVDFLEKNNEAVWQNRSFLRREPTPLEKVWGYFYK